MGKYIGNSSADCAAEWIKDLTTTLARGAFTMRAALSMIADAPDCVSKETIQALARDVLATVEERP